MEHVIGNLKFGAGTTQTALSVNKGFRKKHPFVFLSVKFIVFGLAVVSLLIGGYHIWNGKVSGSLSLVPHTSVAFPLSGLYCGLLTLSREVWDDSEAARAWNSILYVLPEEPKYEKAFTFTIANDNITFAEAGWYMRYVHLHKGSTFTVNSCLAQGSSNAVKLCVIQGESGYNDWVSDPYKCSHEYALADCALSATHYPINNVSEDATYYFIHYTNKSNGGQSLQMNITITSVDYDAESNTALNCTRSNFNSNTCTVRIPLSFRGFGLVTAAVAINETTQSWSWEDSIKVSWSCENSVPPYILVVGIPVVFGAAILFVLPLVCCRYCKCCGKCVKKRNSKITSRSAKLCVKTCFVIPIMCSIFIVVLFFAFLEGIVPVLIYAYVVPSEFVLIPNATRTFSLSKFLCSSLSINTEGSSRLSASLYMTDTSPSLNQSSMKAISEVLTCNNNRDCVKFWRAFMNKNSSLIVTAYSNSFDEAYFLKLDVTDDMYEFNDFLSNPYSYIHKHKSKRIQGNFNYPPFLAPNDAEYIFIVFGNFSLVNITLRFNFTEYFIPPDHQPACETHSYTRTECKTSVPYGVGTTNAILKVSKDEEDVDDSFEYLTVNTTCHLRATSWTAIWLPVLLVNCIIIFPLYAILIKVAMNQQRLKRGENAPLLTSRPRNFQQPVTDSENRRTGNTSSLPQQGSRSSQRTSSYQALLRTEGASPISQSDHQISPIRADVSAGIPLDNSVAAQATIIEPLSDNFQPPGGDPEGPLTSISSIVHAENMHDATVSPPSTSVASSDPPSAQTTRKKGEQEPLLGFPVVDMHAAAVNISEARNDPPSALSTSTKGRKEEKEGQGPSSATDADISATCPVADLCTATLCSPGTVVVREPSIAQADTASVKSPQLSSNPEKIRSNQLIVHADVSTTIPYSINDSVAPNGSNESTATVPVGSQLQPSRDHEGSPPPSTSSIIHADKSTTPPLTRPSINDGLNTEPN